VFRSVITDLKLRSSPGPLTAAAIPDAGRGDVSGVLRGSVWELLIIDE